MPQRQEQASIPTRIENYTMIEVAGGSGPRTGTKMQVLCSPRSAIREKREMDAASGIDYRSCSFEHDL